VTDDLEQGIANIIKKEFGVKYLKRSVVVAILRDLDSRGVVRKVDSGFPEIQSRLTERANAKLLEKQGWSKTERLVK